jgi:hypothetical protein
MFFFASRQFFLHLEDNRRRGGERWFNSGAMVLARNICTEAEFLDVIGIKVMIVYPLAIHSHLYQRILLRLPSEQKWFETGL